MEEFSVRWMAVAAGVLSFLIAYLFDWAALAGIRGLKQAIGVVVVALHGYALYSAGWGAARFYLPAPFLWTGWVLLPASLLLLVYSFFIEIPFTKTYARTGSGDYLVTTGSYALVRHPGVVWYSLFLLSLFFVTGSMTLVVAGPIWLVMDVIYVYIQERFFFDDMFPKYRAYRKQTPMLFPNRRSIARSLKTFNPRRLSSE